ncbi:hypothetical protein BASA81_008334 [Batrachochytrium salamandrivorans]|nr:hypothetical protein BASA81_008334 [Batrachochytrium salamandrivorans]
MGWREGYASFLENTCVLVELEPETWDDCATVWMREVQEWISRSCRRFPLHELLPDAERKSLEVIASSPIDAAAFQFGYTNERSLEEDIPKEFSLQRLHPHEDTRVVIGLLHCPSCKDMNSTVTKFFDKFKRDSCREQIKVFAFQTSALQQEQSSSSNLPALGVEIFPVNSTLVANDSPVCFYANYVLQDVAKHVCLSQLEVVKQAEAVLSATKRLAGGSSGGKPKDVSFQSSSLDHFPSTSFQDLISTVTSGTFPGDGLQVSFGNFTTLASRKEHQKLVGRLQVWIGKHLLLAGLTKPAMLWLETAIHTCKQELEPVWESIAWETLQASKATVLTAAAAAVVGGEAGEMGEYKLHDKMLIALGRPSSPGAALTLFAWQSLRLALAKSRLPWQERGEGSITDVFGTLHGIHKLIVVDSLLGRAYYQQERTLWTLLNKPKLRLLAEIEMRHCVPKLSLFDELLNDNEHKLSKYERRMVLERAVGSAELGEQPMRFAFPLLQAWSRDPQRQADLAELMMRGDGVLLPKAKCPFVESLACLSQPEVVWEEEATVATATASVSSSVFVFDPFAKKQRERIKREDKTTAIAVWCVGEDNYIELVLTNILPFMVAIAYQVVGNHMLSLPSQQQQVVVELHGKAKQIIKLGPYRSELAPDSKLCVNVLGARFELVLPRPHHVEILPLLVREVGGGICNTGKAIAYLNNTRLGPGERVHGLLPAALRYFAKPDFPRFARRLLPVVPTITMAKVSGCELSEHVDFDTASAITLVLELPSSLSCPFTISLGKRVLYTTQSGSSAGGKEEVRIPLPGNCAFADLEMVCNGHTGYVLANPVQVLSTAPPKWIYSPAHPARLEATTGETRVLVKRMDFVKLDMAWERQDLEVRVWFEIDVYYTDSLLPCKSVAWAGVREWEGDSSNNDKGEGENKEHQVWISFLEKGRFLVVFSAISLLRTRWWIKSLGVEVQ